MIVTKDKFKRRQSRVRVRILKSANGRLRLSVFRSNVHIYAQLIDDARRATVVSASTLDKALNGKLEKTSDLKAAESVGKLLAERALEKGIEEVVFDRGGYLYHGRVKALAEAARAGGLLF
jgi:large subunit ribosomal protein L18